MKASKLRAIQAMYRPYLSIGGPALVQSATNVVSEFPSVINCSVTLNNIQRGNLLMIFVSGPGNAVTNPSDNQGTVYTKTYNSQQTPGNAGQTDNIIWGFTGIAPVSGTYVFTINPGGQLNFSTISALEITHATAIIANSTPVAQASASLTAAKLAGACVIAVATTKNIAVNGTPAAAVIDQPLLKQSSSVGGVSNCAAQIVGQLTKSQAVNCQNNTTSPYICLALISVG